VPPPSLSLRACACALRCAAAGFFVLGTAQYLADAIRGSSGPLQLRPARALWMAAHAVTTCSLWMASAYYFMRQQER
jgi:hypothetical protein